MLLGECYVSYSGITCYTKYNTIIYYKKYTKNNLFCKNNILFYLCFRIGEFIINDFIKNNVSININTYLNNMIE